MSDKQSSQQKQTTYVKCHVEVEKYYSKLSTEQKTSRNYQAYIRYKNEEIPNSNNIIYI